MLFSMYSKRPPKDNFLLPDLLVQHDVLIVNLKLFLGDSHSGVCLACRLTLTNRQDPFFQLV